MNKIAIYAIKTIFAVVTFCSLVILSLLNGFTFWPIAIVSIVIVLMFFLAKIIRISNNNLLVPLAIFLTLIILLVLGNFQIIDLKLPPEVNLSGTATRHIAQNSLKEFPIFGSGLSTFYYDFSKFRDIQFNATALWNIRFDNGSGSLFEIAATAGALGAIAVIILVLIALSISFLTLIKTDNKEINSTLLAAFSSFVSALLFSFLFAENNALILFTAIISVFAVASALVMYPEKFKTLKLSFRASAKYALALAAIFLCVSAGVVVLFTMGLKMYLAEKYVRAAQIETNYDSKIANMKKAIALTPYQDIYYINIANDYMYLANQAAQGGDQVKTGDNLSQALLLGKKAVDLEPNKATNNEALALIYENASFYTRGSLEWAEGLYNKVIELDPNNPTPYLRLALVNMAKSNIETDETEKTFFINEAIKKYDLAIGKKSDLAAAYYGKGIAYEKLNNLDSAITELKNANVQAKNNIDYLFELGRLYFNRGVTQLNLSQNATKQMTESEILPPGPEGETPEGETISVTPTPDTGKVASRNEDLNFAEQIFANIVSVNPGHANARYSLAVLYQKLGERDNARKMVDELLKIVPDAATKQLIVDQFKNL